MNLDQLSEIRASIGATIEDLRTELPEATHTALQSHLNALLKEELRALIGQALVADFTEKLNAYIDPRKDTESTPWYPDDSGKWAEWPGGDCPVSKHTRVDILCESERALKSFHPQGFEAYIYCWSAGATDRIVAYKVVKP